MGDFSSITAICVDTLNHELALAACERMAAHGFADLVLVTDDRVDPHLERNAVPGLRIERIAPLVGRGAYSQYVLKSLPQHVHTSHALIFQWDGFVLDTRRWRAEFLDYDYVGGLFPPDIAAQFGQWVGNGGFCLRSARLMAAVAGMVDDCNGIAEDAVICALLSARLQDEHGLRFAPPELAMHFSAEHMTLPNNRAQRPDLVTDDVFGFHGLFNFHLAFDDEALHDLVKTRLGSSRAKLLTSRFAAGLLVNLLTCDRKLAATRLAIEMAPLLGLDPGKVSLLDIVARCETQLPE